MEVFGRDESFDPQNDPVVRIEAGRLRRALEHYYLLSGKDDPVFIEIPKGGYVPTFTARPPAPEAAPPPAAAAPEPAPRRPGSAAQRRALWIAIAAMLVVAIAGRRRPGSRSVCRDTMQPAPGRCPAGPQILVLPFTDLGDGAVSALYSAALTDEVVTALGRFKEIAVLGVQTSRSLPPDPDMARLSDDLGRPIRARGERARQRGHRARQRAGDEQQDRGGAVVAHL